MSEVLILAFINENLITELKLIIKKDFNYDFVSLLSGVILAITFKANIFENILETDLPIILIILTGFLIGRGSNIIYKIIKLLDKKT